ncbi:uncharacterized protein [Emydura macquarii macquarii]|uniref:uncharacterized protein n=1 Tax=Emydura macquarii macquarii TaxID=1129001 RepID=UPI003529E042
MLVLLSVLPLPPPLLLILLLLLLHAYCFLHLSRHQPQMLQVRSQPFALGYCFT